MMTVIRGLSPADNDLPALVTRLKNTCGAGGTISDDGIEIQGSHANRVSEELKKIGYRV
jgi:translation initiation factor 1